MLCWQAPAQRLICAKCCLVGAACTDTLLCTQLQVLIGGGQDAADVTTTNDRAGGFQSRFFHKVTLLRMLLCPATTARSAAA